jgi:hypothetical protein
MKKSISIYIISITLLVGWCNVSSIAGKKEQIKLSAKTASKAVKIKSIKPIIKLSLTFDPKQFTYYPTFAIWLEDVKSGTVKTLYATKKVATNNWGGPAERPSSLPVWYGIIDKQQKDAANKGIDKSSKDQSIADSISSATPSEGTVTLTLAIPKEFYNKKINLYIEDNVSFDYNSYYNENLKEGEAGYNDVNGQPSLIWRGSFISQEKIQRAIPIRLIGHGEVLGKDHNVNSDLTNITTAKLIFSQMNMSYFPDNNMK